MSESISDLQVKFGLTREQVESFFVATTKFANESLAALVAQEPSGPRIKPDSGYKHVGDGYLREVVDVRSLITICDRLIARINEVDIPFDTIVFRGMSGGLVAPTVAMMLGKELLLVRKPKDSHSTHILQGNYNVHRYIIIDDFVATSNTVRTIIRTLDERLPHETVPVALFLYNERFNWEDSEQTYEGHRIPVRPIQPIEEIPSMF